MTPEERWEAGRQKTLKYNQEAVDYDDEDSICLDNLGQTWYRVMSDPEKAKEWFDKAHAVKPEQIDTLYFLSRYDLARGDRKAAAEKLETALEGRFSALNYCSGRTDRSRSCGALKEERNHGQDEPGIPGKKERGRRSRPRRRRRKGKRRKEKRAWARRSWTGC